MKRKLKAMRLLCIEDDEGLLYLLKEALEEANFEVTGVSNGEDGLHLLQHDSFDAVVVDHEMPMMSGLEVIRRLQDMHNDVPIVMVTGAGNEEIAVMAMRSGASDYLVKDTDLGYLKILPLVIRQVLHERELARAHEAAERALQLEKDRARLLTQFIQDASHEFRSPLTVIQTSCDLLGRITSEPKQQTHVERIKVQSDAILMLVNQLVQLARLDNTPSLDVMSVDLKDIIEVAVGERHRLLTERNLQLSLDLPEDAVMIVASLDELQSALCELIDNACRYSTADGELHIALEGDDDVAVIMIRDTGIGMTEEQLSHIFERFYRGDAAHSTRGFGLGLPMAARVIDLHHGEIEIESEPDAGTSVTVRLPVNQT